MKLEGVHCGNGGAMAILTRLAEADWFISRVPVSVLTPWLYAVLTFDEDRTQILKIHRRLSPPPSPASPAAAACT